MIMDPLQTVCLICRQPQETLCDLTGQEFKDDAEKLSALIRIPILAYGSLPWNICRDCIDTLDVVHDFLQLCEETKQRLQEELCLEKEVIVKNEPLDATEDEELQYKNGPDKWCTTEEDLAPGKKDLDEDRKDMVLEEPKLAEPVATDKDLEMFTCQICSESYVTRDYLRRHEQRVHGEKPFVCDLCGKAFSRKEALVMHRRLHLEKNRYPFKCEICDRTFKHNKRLNIHRRVHTKEKPYECDRCPMKFRTNDSLYKHRSIHTGERRYKCDQCNKTFRLHGGLQSHKRVHSEEKAFKCTTCEMAFRSWQTLRRHSNTHDKPSVPKPVEAETLIAIAERRTSEEQESSEVIEHVKKEELSS